jgi:hypothetical protein
MVDERQGSDRAASDLPVDLSKERESFVRSFLKKGVELTEQLLRENEDLRQQLARAQDDNARLLAQVASDDAIRELLTKIELLEREKRQLLARSEALSTAKRADDDRYSEIERELNDLANLYVASFQLHTSLSPRRVLRHVLDMLGQLVGAYSSVVYVAQGDKAVPVALENVNERVNPVQLGDGPIGEACLTGIARIPEKLTPGSVADPLVIVPILVEGRPAGAITIISVLAQKQAWASVDQELFKLLGAHAGPAIVAANLYASVANTQEAFRGLVENLKKRGSTLVPPADIE